MRTADTKTESKDASETLALQSLAQSLDGSRATLKKTVLICAALLLALLVIIVLMALLGSEKLPAQASICALATLGKQSCGLSADQNAILFDIRLPRILLGAAVGASL